MKAIVYREYGSPDVLKCEEIEKPVPTDDEVLIKVRVAAVNLFDYHMLRQRSLRERGKGKGVTGKMGGQFCH